MRGHWSLYYSDRRGRLKHFKTESDREAVKFIKEHPGCTIGYMNIGIPKEESEA